MGLTSIPYRYAIRTVSIHRYRDGDGYGDETERDTDTKQKQKGNLKRALLGEVEQAASAQRGLWKKRSTTPRAASHLKRRAPWLPASTAPRVKRRFSRRRGCFGRLALWQVRLPVSRHPQRLDPRVAFLGGPDLGDKLHWVRLLVAIIPAFPPAQLSLGQANSLARTRLCHRVVHPKQTNWLSFGSGVRQ